jgi:hypothetical protein
MSRVSTRVLLSGGIVGSIGFVAAFLILGAVRPDYDPMRQFVSLLSLGEGGTAMTIVFLVCGLLIVGAAIGSRRVLHPGIACRWAPVMVGLAGFGLIIAGTFPTDPVQGYPPGTPLEMPATASWHAILHLTGALFFFVGLPIASFFVARRFAAGGERRWAAYSISSGLIMILANAVTSAAPGTVGLVPDVAGLLQRISISVGLVWLAVVSARFLRDSPALR